MFFESTHKKIQIMYGAGRWMRVSFQPIDGLGVSGSMPVVGYDSSFKFGAYSPGR